MSNLNLSNNFSVFFNLIVTNSTQTEGYHWDTSDLYLADGNHNQHNHAENFTHVVQYNFDNSNIINGNDNDDCRCTNKRL